MTPQPTQGTPEGRLPSGAQQVVQLAIADLARVLDLAPEEISVTSVEAVEWPDASLGCPEQGMMYAQVITPGYRVVLQAGGQAYEYHSGDGRLVLCEQTDNGQPRPVPVVDDGHPWISRDTAIEPTWPRK